METSREREAETVLVGRHGLISQDRNLPLGGPGPGCSHCWSAKDGSRVWAAGPQCGHSCRLLGSCPRKRHSGPRDEACGTCPMTLTRLLVPQSHCLGVHGALMPPSSTEHPVLWEGSSATWCALTCGDRHACSLGPTDPTVLLSAVTVAGQWLLGTCPENSPGGVPLGKSPPLALSTAVRSAFLSSVASCCCSCPPQPESWVARSQAGTAVHSPELPWGRLLLSLQPWASDVKTLPLSVDTMAGGHPAEALSFRPTSARAAQGQAFACPGTGARTGSLGQWPDQAPPVLGAGSALSVTFPRPQGASQRGLESLGRPPGSAAS